MFLPFVALKLRSLPSLSTTVQTRLPGHPALNAYGALFGHVERRLHAAFASGRLWRGDLQTSFYQQFDITSNHLDHVRKSLEGRLRAVEEGSRYQANHSREKAKAKRKQIAEKEKELAKTVRERKRLEGRRDDAHAAITKARPDLDSIRSTVAARAGKRTDTARAKLKAVEEALSGLRQKIRLTRDALHRHKRRAQVLDDRAKAMDARAETPSLAFGTRRLFRAQNDLLGNDYASHDEWRGDWRDARDGHFFVEGLTNAPDGNSFVSLDPQDDGTFSMELRLPRALAHLSDGGYVSGGQCIHYVLLHGLRFEHGRNLLASWILAHRMHEQDPGLPRGKPITFRFVRDAKGWRVCVTASVQHAEPLRDYSRGALGVDLNEHDVVVTRADESGNPVGTWAFPMCCHGLTGGQRRALVRKVVAEIVALARLLELPLVMEKLDFTAKKAELGCGEHPARARMLSFFAYAEFGRAMESACMRADIHLQAVNPAYTSLIGRVGFAPRYGLSVHAAAALAIARRAMRMSERAPAPADGGDGKAVVSVRLDSGVHVALPAAESRPRRHVWSSWRALSNGIKAVHEARARASRERRSAWPRGGDPTPPGRAMGDGAAAAPSRPRGYDPVEVVQVVSAPGRRPATAGPKGMGAGVRSLRLSL